MRIREHRLATTLPYIALSCGLLLFCLTWNRVMHHDGSGFWDARVYPKALAAWKAHGNPYEHGPKDARYLYPPLFLVAAKSLGVLFPQALGWYVYLALHFMAALTIPYLIARSCGPKTWMTPVLALVLFVFQPDVYSLIAILGGNIATLLYALLLGAGWPGLRSNRWGWMYAAVILASWVKPAYLPWLLVPLLCGHGQRWWSLTAAAVTGAGYLVQKMALPVAYGQFQRAVAMSSYTREAGLGIYALVLKLAQKVPGYPSRGAWRRRRRFIF